MEMKSCLMSPRGRSVEKFQLFTVHLPPLFNLDELWKTDKFASSLVHVGSQCLPCQVPQPTCQSGNQTSGILTGVDCGLGLLTNWRKQIFMKN